MIPPPQGERNKINFKKWLEILQQESWQLELIISGFAIFLLVQTGEPLNQAINFLDIRFSGNPATTLVKVILTSIKLGRGILIVNLIMHVLFRGLWIATIGLRYVSGEIDIDALKYGPLFEEHLKRKLPDFDDYIETLEKICSILFSFTFVIVFCIISVAMFFVVFLAVALLIAYVAVNINSFNVIILMNVVIGFFTIVYIIFLLLYFIDFVTFGRIKKWTWIAKIYLPIYRLFNYISLAFLYRPLMYNMIDNPFGRKMSRLFVPYIAIGFFLSTLYFDWEFYKPEHYRGSLEVRSDYYESLETDVAKLQESRILLPDKYIDKPYLEMFIRARTNDDMKTIGRICPDFEKFRSGKLKSHFQINFNMPFERDNQPDDAGLTCWQQLYFIDIDGKNVDAAIDWHFYQHPLTDMPGFLGMLNIDSMESGKHILTIKKQKLESSDFSDQKNKLDTALYVRIPFWKIDPR